MSQLTDHCPPLEEHCLSTDTSCGLHSRVVKEAPNVLPLIADCHNDIALDKACTTEAHMQHPLNQ